MSITFACICYLADNKFSGRGVHILKYAVANQEL